MGEDNPCMLLEEYQTYSGYSRSRLMKGKQHGIAYIYTWQLRPDKNFSNSHYIGSIMVSITSETFKMNHG